MSSAGLIPPPPMDVSHGFTASPLDFLVENHERHGDIFVTRMHGTPTVFCGGATGPLALFRAERGHLEVHNTELVHDLFGRAIFTLRGAEHLQARRTLRLGLTARPLRSYAEGALRLAQGHVARWSGGRFDLYQEARGLTLDACARIVLGLRPGHADYRALPALFDAFVRGTDVPSQRRHVAFAYWRARRAATELRALIDRRTAAARRKPGVDVASHLMTNADQLGLDTASLSDHLLAVLMATRETTASLITWLLVELAREPTGADSLQHEARTLVADPSLLTDHKAVPHLRARLLEAERLHSPNAISVRAAVSGCRLGDHVIPPGWRVAYSPAANHLLPQLYDDPLRFRPQRFSGRRHGQATRLLTFGQGLHACPGKQLAELLVLAAAAAVFAGHTLALPEGVPTALRYLPVKAPIVPIAATLYPSRRSTE